MRLLLWVTMLVTVSSFILPAHAQDKVDYEFSQAGLREVLTTIRKKTGVDFSMQQTHESQFKPISLSVKSASLSQVLSLSFAGQPLSYQIRNNTIIISARAANQNNVSGVVTDDKRTPLSGASLRIKGTNISARTDQNGSFSLNNIPADAELEISYLGYVVRNIDLSTSNRGNIGPIFILQQKLSELEEVVVLANTGYQKLDPSKATGSLVVIDEAKIRQNPSLSLMQRLEGQVAGVQFSPKNNRIQVRTPNSYFGDTKGPLIIIDGFPAMEQQLTSNPTGDGGRMSATTQSSGILNNFNPDDIASITVLKDAAAASIWGSRAANGVIVIETKSGRSGGNSINFSSTFGTSAPANLNNLRTMNAFQYIDFERELFNNNFFYDPKDGWRSMNVSESLTSMFQHKNGQITEAELESRLAEMGQRNNRDQIREYLLQQAQSQQYNLSFNGKAQNGRYFASITHSNDQPIYKENFAKNTGITFNIDNSYFNNKVKVALSINHMMQNSKVNNAALTAISPGTYGLTPYDMLTDGNGQSLDRYYLFTPAVTQERFESKGYLPWTYNHIDELQYSNDRYDNNITRMMGNLTYSPFTWLNASLLGSYQKGLRSMESLRERESYEMRNMINTGTTINAQNRLVYGVPMGGRLITSNQKSDDYSIRFQLDGHHKWNNQHEINVFAGTEIRQTRGQGYIQTRYGFDPDTYQSILVNSLSPYTNIYGANANFNIQDAGINITKQRFLSYYANAGYTFLNKYYATGSLRFDDATIIGIDRSNRARPFWSAGLRWDAHKESFLQNVDWINMLSVRSSLGTGGSVPSSGTSYTIVQRGAPDSFTQLPTGYISTPANQQLGWERTRTFNTGLEAGMFNNRLNVSFDAYSKRSTGIVVSLPFNTTYGWPTMNFNTANLKSNGLEFQVSGDILRKQDWNWNSSFNFAYNDNEVTDSRFPNVNNSPDYASVISGYPLDAIRAYYWGGLDEKGRSQIKNAAGEIINADATTGSFTPDDLRYMGRTTPPYFGGWTNSVSYKNLTLTARFTFQAGHRVRSKEITAGQYPTGTTFQGFLSTSTALVDRWQQPGDEAFTNIPGVISSNQNSVSRFISADINVLDASHIRFQLLSLDYRVNGSFVGATKAIKSLNVGVTASNLGVLWKKSSLDIDPEYLFDGSYQSMPPTPHYLFTVRLGL
ncbi:SusC/RagA family TonB-linked outer membrane protein [Sphingobacterium corticis]|uniref:SusC/RagA family TonB-linked outer membrane protein n=1 Tax=Sphingobacterium corticis TaxID=1812823 RepID=A0ABW5NN25_9SPHI